MALRGAERRPPARRINSKGKTLVQRGTEPRMRIRKSLKLGLALCSRVLVPTDGRSPGRIAKQRGVYQLEGGVLEDFLADPLIKP